MKKLLNLKGVTLLSKSHQKVINGGAGSCCASSVGQCSPCQLNVGCVIIKTPHKYCLCPCF